MKKSLTALALALALAGTLASCSADKNPTNGAASGNNGAASGSMNGSASGAPGTVSRRYDGRSVYNGRTYNEPTYFDDGRYAADGDGRVYGSSGSDLSRDLTRGARDLVRGAGDAVEDVGRGIGNAARDITGTNPGTPSWEPDSSAVRY